MQAAFAAYQRGENGEAERLARAVLGADPDNFDAHHVLAVVAAHDSRRDEAVASYDRALAIRPDDVQALSNRGVALNELGRYGEALMGLDRALALRPDFLPALSNRGNALRGLGRHDEALASYDRALSLSPDFPEALSNRGNALHEMRRYEEALASYERALAARPNYPEALSNRGLTLQQLGRFGEALASFDRALAIAPHYADCRCNRALLLLLIGRFAEGWAEYEWRRQLGSWHMQSIDAPEWRGEGLRGKRLLLRAEQGLGDTIQFARFAPLLAARGAAVILDVQRPLGGLLQSLDGAPTIVRQGDSLPPIDLQLPLLSVPLLLGVDGASIPAEIPYIKADPAQVERWRERLMPGGFRIGIAWQGSPQAFGRAVPLNAFAPLAQIAGVRLISLQKHHGLDQLAQLPPGMEVHDLGEGFDAGPDGFLDTAAVMAHLDLVISADTAIAHLAGALGRPVWILLADVPDWRWMLGREDSPWYPTARLFRQRRRGDWDEVMARVAAELAVIARGQPRQSSAAAVASARGAPISGYVVSLPRRADRQQRFMRWNAGKGVDLRLFDAVDGGTLDRQELVRANLIADENLAFSAGALGNALSHRALWLKCLEGNQPILVFEDDAYLGDGLREWIEPIRRELDRGCDILYLGYNRDVGFSLGYGDGAWCNIGFDRSPGEFDELMSIYDRRSDRDAHCILDARLVWGTLAYAISPRGVETLLRQCFPLAAKFAINLYGTAQVGLPYALDGIINSLVQRGRIKARAIFPPLVVGPNDLSDSDVVGPAT